MDSSHDASESVEEESFTSTAIEEEKSSEKQNKRSSRGGMVTMLNLGRLKSLKDDDFLKYMGKGLENTKKTIIGDNSDAKKKKRKRNSSKKSSQEFKTPPSTRSFSVCDFDNSMLKERMGRDQNKSFDFKYAQDHQDDSFLDNSEESKKGSSFSPRKNEPQALPRPKSQESSNASERRAALLQRYATISDDIHTLTSQEKIENDKEVQLAKGANKKFHKRFKDLPEELVIENFLCALLLRGALLAQGSMYITQNYVNFYANIFGKVTRVSIRFGDILSVRKCKILKSIPNSIEIHTVTKKYFFASFLHRENAYQLIDSRWRQIRQMSGIPVIDNLKPMEDAHIDWGDSIGYDWEDDEVEFSFPPQSVACCHQKLQCTSSPRYSQQFPIPVKAFYKHFFSESSEGFWTELHSAANGYDNFTMADWISSVEACCFERQVDFVAPIPATGVSRVSLAPKQTRVTQKQRCRFVSDTEIIFETSSHSHDVIYSKQFLVDALWRVTATPTGCQLDIFVFVRFVRRNWLRFMIEKNALEGSREWFEAWIHFALTVSNHIKANSSIPKPLRASNKFILRQSTSMINSPRRGSGRAESTNQTSSWPKQLFFAFFVFLLLCFFCFTAYYYYYYSMYQTLNDELEEKYSELKQYPNEEL